MTTFTLMPADILSLYFDATSWREVGADDISLLDFWTTHAIEVIWRQQVNDCKHANDTSPATDSDIETGYTGWFPVQYIPCIINVSIEHMEEVD